MEKRLKLILLSSLLLIFLIWLVSLTKPLSLLEEKNIKKNICQEGDLTSLLEEYLSYVHNTYFENGEVISDPIEQYSYSNFNASKNTISHEYLSHSPSRIINLIYATKLTVEYLERDSHIADDLLHKYFSITEPFKSINDAPTELPENLTNYLNQQFRLYLNNKGLNLEELIGNDIDKIAEESELFLKENQNEINYFLQENNISDISIEDLLPPSEEDANYENSYYSQNIISYCYPLKYMDVLTEKEKVYFTDICLNNYNYLEKGKLCTEEIITTDQLQGAIKAFVSKDKKLFTELNFTENLFESYYLFDFSSDFFILSKIYDEDKIDSSCLIQAGNYYFGHSLYKLFSNYETTGSYNTNGIFQALSLVNFLLNSKLSNLDTNLLENLKTYLFQETLNESQFLINHDTNLHKVFEIEDSYKTYDYIDLFSIYCNNNKVPLSLYTEVTEDTFLGSIDATSRMIVNFILSKRK